MRLHNQTLLEYHGRGRCGLVVCQEDTLDTYLEEMKTWATGVDRDSSDIGDAIDMTKRETIIFYYSRIKIHCSKT